MTAGVTRSGVTHSGAATAALQPYSCGMHILRGIVPALLVALAVGCSSSESGGPAADGGLPTGDGGPGADGGPGPGSDGGDAGTSPTCTVLGTNAIANEPKQLSNLEVTATSVVFLSVPDGAAPPASIEKMNLDGTGRTTLYTSAGDRRIHSMKVQGDVAYFFETDNAATIPVDELWSIPLAGGTPTRVGTVSFDGPRFIGSDAANLYVAYDAAAANAIHFDRVVLASGTVENAALLPDRAGANMTSITGNDVFFWAAKTGADANVADIFRFDKTATAAAPTALPGGVDALCDIRTAGLFSTPTKVACGFSGLNAYGHDGSGLSPLIPKDLTHLGPNVLVGSDAETLYVFNREKALQGVGTIVKISSSGGAITPVACDLSTLQNRLVDASFPVQTEYEVTVGATDVYWIEKRQSGGAPAAWFVRHAPK